MSLNPGAQGQEEERKARVAVILSIPSLTIQTVLPRHVAQTQKQIVRTGRELRNQFYPSLCVLRGSVVSDSGQPDGL